MPNASLCVYCRQRPMEPAWRPFCSERCKLTDLGRWLLGDYRVPAPPAEDAQTPPDAADDADPGDR